MPCPACGEDPSGTEWKWDPLRWELDPPCTEAEWRYLADSTGAPEVMTTQQCAYMKKVCRGCYNSRLLIMAKEYEAAHANDLLKNRAAKIHGLQSADHFNGQVCRLIVNGEKKAIRESNLHASQDVDMEWEAARVEYAASNSTSAQTDGKPVGRPLGTHTSWEKGFHPGAVVFLQNLKTKAAVKRKICF
eukprot:g25935.t1